MTTTSVETDPFFEAFEETVTLKDSRGMNPREAKGIVSLDTVVQDQGLWLHRSFVTIKAEDPILGQAESGHRITIRGRDYSVRLVELSDDPAWKRLVID